MNLDGYLLATGMDLYRGNENFRKYYIGADRVARIEEFLKKNGAGYSFRKKESASMILSSRFEERFSFKRRPQGMDDQAES